MAKMDLPDNPEIAGIVAQGQLAESNKRLEMGLIGRLLGGAAEKPGNIAGLVVSVFSAAFLCFLTWGGDTASLSKKEALAIIGGFITLALGFIFGRSSKD